MTDYSQIEKYLPMLVKAELHKSDDMQRKIFAEEFDKKRRRLSVAYALLFLAVAHRWYLGRPVMTFFQWALLFVAIGFIWAIIDVLFLPGMVRERNAEIAKAILAEHKMMTGTYAVGISQPQPSVINISNTSGSH